MKKLTLFLAVCFCSTTLFSQNITNTLAPNGNFKIKDGSADYLSLSQSTGFLSLNRSLVLPNTTSSTTGVIYKGAERFLHNYGALAGNTFLGLNSGNFTMTGSLNTAVGYQSLISNSTGSQNIAIGFNSLYTNTSGNYNTAVGKSSLQANSTGFENTAIGWNSLYSSTGNNNTGVGSSSLSNNTGDNNTAVGSRSLQQNFTGTENTAVGRYSLYYNYSGNSNTALGFNSLSYNSAGSQNTAVGHHSLIISTGNYNTALGYNAGSTVTTGENLTLIGIDANPSSPTAIDQITLGNGFVTSLRCNVQTITSLSDARDKKNIKDLNLGINFIMKLKPRIYNWDKREWYDDNKSDGSKMKEEPTAGFIAQELDEAQTTENVEWLNLVLKDNPEKWEATPGNLFPVLVKAVQELAIKNEELTIKK